MIISRYLIRAVVVPWLTATTGLVFIFASYSLTRNLADAAQNRIAIGLAVKMIGLHVIVALEVLVPLGLYLGTIIGLGRLYSDQEMIALQAGGVTRGQMLRPLIGVALSAALLVALLSIVVRPWAYDQLYVIQNDARTQMRVDDISPDSFYSDGSAGMTLYAAAVRARNHRLDDVFVSTVNKGRRIIIRAASMTRERSADPAVTLIFHDGHLYDLAHGSGDDRLLDFKTLNFRLDEPARTNDYQTAAASTATLWRSSDPKDIAERQWRLSRPLATVLLAMLGIIFARSAPRRGRAANVLAATLCFVVYFNLTGVARAWVSHAVIPALPGIYWVDGLVTLLVVALWFRSRTNHY